MHPLFAHRWLIAAILAVTCVLAAAPAPAHAQQPSIWTDKPQYNLGDPIQICFRVPGPGPIRITDLLPDGRSQVVAEWYDDGRGDCISGTITPPTGRECVRLDYSGARGSGSVQTCFQVLAQSGGSAPPPPPPPQAQPSQPSRNAALRMTVTPDRIQRGAGQSNGVQWNITETNGVGVTFSRRTWTVSGCFDRGCLLFTEPLYGREGGPIERNFRVGGYGSASWQDWPGAAGCGQGYAYTRIDMTFEGTDDNGNPVSITSNFGHLTVECTSGPQEQPLGGLDLDRYCKEKFGPNAVARLFGGTDWFCTGSGTFNEISPNRMTEACEWQYGRSDLYARMLNPTDPYSWRCFIKPN